MTGSVTRPTGASSIMWLPQRPYLLQGSLRDQVVYPQDPRTAKVDDARVKECLIMAGLSKFVDGSMNVGLNTRHLEWNDVLSGGERQRIGFARLYYHAPKFAILDEATSAINPDEESKLYERLFDTRTTVVSIAHRLELRKIPHARAQDCGRRKRRVQARGVEIVVILCFVTKAMLLNLARAASS